MKVLLIILGVLLLIALIPVGAIFRYDGTTQLRLILGPFRPKLIPAKPKTRKQLEKAEKKKAKKAAKKAEKKRKKQAQALMAKPKEAEKPPQTLSEKLRGLLPWAKLGVQLFGTVFRRLLIKKLTIRVKLAGGDCAKLAETTAKAWSAIGMAMPFLDRAFRIRKREIMVAPDFVGDKTEIEAEIRLRFLVADLAAIAGKYGFRAVRLLFAQKKQKKETTSEEQHKYPKKPTKQLEKGKAALQ